MNAMSHKLYSAAGRVPAYRFAQRAAAAGAPRQLQVIRFRCASSATSDARPSWEIRMLYDGDCPLCMREVKFLRTRDEGKGKIDFVDVAADTYDPAANQNITFDQAMGRIHAIKADGSVITDVEVFRQLYEAVGLGWVYAITKVEPIGTIVDKLYAVWAKYRMEVTGREPLAVILEKRRTQGKTCADLKEPVQSSAQQ